jgi:hypothetical protein
MVARNKATMFFIGTLKICLTAPNLVITTVYEHLALAGLLANLHLARAVMEARPLQKGHATLKGKSG